MKKFIIPLFLILRGLAEKTPGGGVFFHLFSSSLAEKKKNPPPGAFCEFFEYYSDYQTNVNKYRYFK